MPRRTVHVKVTDEAHKNIHAFARKNGVTVSGLVEAFIAVTAGIDQGGELPVDMSPPTPAERLGGLVAHARQIDADRRARS